MSLKFLLLTILLSTQLMAKSHMAFIGGGGEPAGAGTIFDHDVGNVSTFLQKDAKWITSIAYNGGHKHTESLLAPLKKKTAIKPFTSANYNQLIKDYIQKINNGQITQGDQLLLYISSHGAQGRKGEATHRISTSGKQAIDLNTLQGSNTVSLDTLKKLSELALRKGIKLGIIDMSCHSGASLALANKSTCVISSTGPNHLSWGGTSTTFSAQYSKNIKSGRSLEDVFLAANRSKTDASFPMISSSAGKKIQDSIYQEISPYLYDARDPLTQKKMEDYYNEQYEDNECRILDKNYLLLTKYFMKMSKIGIHQNLSPVRQAVHEYYQLQKGLRASLQKKNSPPLNEKKTICDTHKKKCVTHTVFDLLQMDTIKSKDFLRAKIKASPPQAIAALVDQITLLDNIDVLKNDYQKRYPKLGKSVDAFASEHLRKETRRLAKLVSKELQIIYPQIYQDMKKLTATAANPCAEIKF